MIIAASEVATALGVAEDASLTRLVGVIDAHVKRYCGRGFEHRAIVEIFDGTGTNTLPLTEWPVTEITEVRIDPLGQFSDGSVWDVSYFWARRGNLYIRLARFPEQEGSVQVSWSAGYYPADDTDPDHASNLMPEDLRDCVIQLVSDAQKKLGAEEFQQEHIGAYHYVRFEQGMSPRLRRVLDSFRRWF